MTRLVDFQLELATEVAAMFAIACLVLWMVRP